MPVELVFASEAEPVHVPPACFANSFGRNVAMLGEWPSAAKPAESVLSQSGVNIVSMTPS
jgi:hypothetical protein